MSFTKSMTDEQLLDVVKAMDNASKLLDRRFEGDDDAIVKLMVDLDLSQNLANKALITGEVLRECLHRGLQMARGN